MKIALLNVHHSLLVAMLCLCSGPDLMAEDTVKWRVELQIGDAWNLPSSVHIHQDGYADIDADVHFKTKGLEAPRNWSGRVSRWVDGRAWELEIIHHKLHWEDDLHDDVQYFEVTDGYNLYFLNRAWSRGPLEWRVGGGIVITNPETRIRDKYYYRKGGGEIISVWDGTYHLSGPAAQAGVGYRFDLGRGFSFGVEGKVIGGYGFDLPIADGTVDVWNVSVHARIGPSFEW